MAPATVNSLPIEIHTEILNILLSLSRRPDPLSEIVELMISNSSPGPLRPVTFEWIDKEGRSVSIFPFNVASVCKLWRDILAQIPEYWTRVVFDVAHDPTPRLDAFLWSTDLEKIEVLVFNSSDADFVVVDNVTEARRVSAIVQALQPHIHRCKSIVFDVTYSSSLPPPTVFFLQQAPHLEQLILECHIDDIERRTDAWTHPIGPDREPFPTSFPVLQKISLTGFWFMYLALYKTQWLLEVQFGSYSALHITQFAFLDRGFYTLPLFVYHISKVDATSFSFSNLTLSYDYEDLPRQLEDHVHEISCEHVNFSSVSKDFLSQFFALANLRASESQSFNQCEIPIIRQVQHGCELTLENILDYNNSHSLRNILGVWSGTFLAVSSCPSFNDTFLSWLGTEVEYAYADPRSPPEGDEDDTTLRYSGRFASTRRGFRTFPAEGMEGLSVHNCTNFTSSALRGLIGARNKVSLAENGLGFSRRELDPAQTLVQSLDVTGLYQPLEKADEVWFKTCCEDMSLNWTRRTE